ncbi:hypothetical protein F5I97DRAFT_1929423 [Phlebopus sp. FC_14]|nr:hypothetical protein F5I97DRAFT_1929423 [Phlebopus sp. FC_14]
MRCLFSTAILLWVTWANAQTETVVNADGATVVEVVTVNAVGAPTTQILQTLVGTTPSLSNRPATLTTSTPLTTSNPLVQQTLPVTSSTAAVQPGPVGQPASEQAAGGPTPYTYTTTNANGETVALQGIFTPTGPATVLPPVTTTGTILDYSSWLKSLGTNTTPANAASRVSIATGWSCFVVTVFVGIGGGAWMVLL